MEQRRIIIKGWQHTPKNDIEIACQQFSIIGQRQGEFEIQVGEERTTVERQVYDVSVTLPDEVVEPRSRKYKNVCMNTVYLAREDFWGLQLQGVKYDDPRRR